jgi:hypothetical protein
MNLDNAGVFLSTLQWFSQERRLVEIGRAHVW